jgi:L-ascorbate metabolism protein UlaG (beta-lactamase superfamily)
VADLESIAKRTGAKVFCNWEIGQWLGGRGVTNVQPMNLGGSAAVPGGRATMELAWHSSSLPDGTYGGNPCGWLLDVAGMLVYVAGDTALFSDLERIGRRPDGRRIDAAILPIGDLFTMGPEASREAIRLLRPRLALPCHYGTWPPIAQDAAAWARGVEADGVATPRVLAPGESVRLA